eukprot:Rmarinus@m.16304
MYPGGGYRGGGEWGRKRNWENRGFGGGRGFNDHKRRRPQGSPDRFEGGRRNPHQEFRSGPGYGNWQGPGRGEARYFASREHQFYQQGMYPGFPGRGVPMPFPYREHQAKPFEAERRRGLDPSEPRRRASSREASDHEGSMSEGEVSHRERLSDSGTQAGDVRGKKGSDGTFHSHSDRRTPSPKDSIERFKNEDLQGAGSVVADKDRQSTSGKRSRSPSDSDEEGEVKDDDILPGDQPSESGALSSPMSRRKNQRRSYWDRARPWGYVDSDMYGYAQNAWSQYMDRGGRHGRLENWGSPVGDHTSNGSTYPGWEYPYNRNASSSGKTDVKPHHSIDRSSGRSHLTGSEEAMDANSDPRLIVKCVLAVSGVFPHRVHVKISAQEDPKSAVNFKAKSSSENPALSSSTAQEVLSAKSSAPAEQAAASRASSPSGEATSPVNKSASKSSPSPSPS